MTSPGSTAMAPARRLVGFVACGVVLVCLALVPVAVDAAKPKSVKPKAGNYSGHAKVPRISRRISFRVPASKKSLQEVSFPTCSNPNGSGLRGVPRSINAKVSKKGKIKGEASFRSRVEYEIGPYDELDDWTLKINGKFTKATKAKGRLSISMTGVKVHRGTETPVAGDRAGGSRCNTGSVTWKAGRQ